MRSIRLDPVRVITLSACVSALLAGPPPGGCRADGPPAIPTSEAFRDKYLDSVAERPLVEEAISLANSILGPENPFVLLPSWGTDPAPGKKVVPVFLGVPRNSKSTSVAFVPDRERCIIIEAKEIPKLEALMGNQSDRAAQQSPAQLLAFALLHESGHVALGHSGCFDQAGDEYVIIERALDDARLRMENMNRIDDRKQRELDADAFAAGKLTTSINSKNEFPRSLRGMRIGSTLTMVGFNLAANRMLDGFGSGVLGSKKYFWDKGETHPNFEYRILHINALMAPDSQYPKLAKDFEAMRYKLEAGILFKNGQARDRKPAGGKEGRK